MANALYHKLPDNTYLNINNPGGPFMWRVQYGSDENAYFAQFSADGVNFIKFPTPFTTVALAQAALDNVIAQINAGTFPA
jgi:hypothetical protein